MKATEEQIELFFEYVIRGEVDDLRISLQKFQQDQDLESVMAIRYNGQEGKYAGKTPLGIACKFGNLALVQLLLPYSSTLNADSKGDFPIHNALDAELVNPDIVELVLENLKIKIPAPAARTQINAMDQTALSHSVVLLDPNGDLRLNTTKQLLDAGLDINAGSAGDLPLLAAIMLQPEFRSDAVIDMLLAHKADITKSIDGENSLRIAANEGYKYAAKAILAKATALGCHEEMLQGIDKADFETWANSDGDDPYGGYAANPYGDWLSEGNSSDEESSMSDEEHRGPAKIPGTCDDLFTDQ